MQPVDVQQIDRARRELVRGMVELGADQVTSPVTPITAATGGTPNTGRGPVLSGRLLLALVIIGGVLLATAIALVLLVTRALGHSRAGGGAP